MEEVRVLVRTQTGYKSRLSQLSAVFGQSSQRIPTDLDRQAVSRRFGSWVHSSFRWLRGECVEKSCQV